MLKNWDLAEHGEVLERIDPFPSITLMEKVVHVTDLDLVGAHRLRLGFNDGTVGEVDFSNEDWSGVFARVVRP
ncbi:MAG TPA: hypothetical protein VFY75_03700 [Solirubrobacterales bacterium]|nr:hypothetical protein [Solirubrobacterales bacterium]